MYYSIIIFITVLCSVLIKIICLFPCNHSHSLYVNINKHPFVKLCNIYSLFCPYLITRLMLTCNKVHVGIYQLYCIVLGLTTVCIACEHCRFYIDSLVLWEIGNELTNVTYINNLFSVYIIIIYLLIWQLFPTNRDWLLFSVYNDCFFQFINAVYSC